MNIRSSNPFYLELIESNIFSEQQKNYISRVYQKHQDIINKKVRITVKHSAYVGRPSKIRNKKTFNSMLQYYRRGFISQTTIRNIFGIGRSTFFRRLSEIYVEDETFENPFSEESMKEIEEIFNKYCYDYANIWTEKLLKTKYHNDMRQDCLVSLWEGVIHYYSTDASEKIPFKAFCNNICEIILDKYIKMTKNDRRFKSIDFYNEEYGESSFINLREKI